MELLELKKQAEIIRQNQSDKGRTVWSAEFKSLVFSFLENGETPKSISAFLDLPLSTIYKWKYEIKKKTKFKEITVVETQQTPLVLSWQGGLRVEGLSFVEFKELLREGLL